jgi:hypothetical protein
MAAMRLQTRPQAPGWYLVQPVIQGEPQAPTACEVKGSAASLKFATIQLSHEWREVAAKEFDDWLWFGPFPSRSAAFVPAPPGEQEPVAPGA